MTNWIFSTDELAPVQSNKNRRGQATPPTSALRARAQDGSVVHRL